MLNLSITDANLLHLTGYNPLRDYVQKRRDQINQQDRENWACIQNLEDWETYVRPRLKALRASLGHDPAPPARISPKITGRLKGVGYTIENIAFESRPNIYVSANRYLPDPAPQNMPGIIIVHSHHNPKTQGELQDMGILWARAGCTVLVMDAFGYGDRRDHPFAPRQDYWFRDITGKQLHTLGDSLMGWMVWDIHRCVDLLLQSDNINPQKIITMGAVAGGGDPCAVATALDTRITCAIPFNFGGPQPETQYPLPDDAEASFNYLGSGSWESTRNLRLSGQDGFLPWLIVASIAPRKLIYAHEFDWDQDRDPVWKRLKKIYKWYGAEENLNFTHGFGLLQGRPPQASHCNNIGVPHRQRIYSALQRWFDIPPPKEEIQERHPDDKLCSITPELKAELRIPRVHQVLKQMAHNRALSTAADRKTLQNNWRKMLGDISPEVANIDQQESETHRDYTLSKIIYKNTQNIPIPTLLFSPPKAKQIVIAISQQGKRACLESRQDDYQTLISNNIAVCLPDLSGTGETAPEGARTFRSTATSQSANLMMFGETSLGLRLKDLRSLIKMLSHMYPNTGISLWGDSLSPTNPPSFDDPLLNDDRAPHQAEPAGGILALLCALFEPNIKAIATTGQLASYACIFDHTHCYLPHDIVVPGAVGAGDLPDIASILAPTPLLLTHLVNARNQLLDIEQSMTVYHNTTLAYEKHPNPFTISSHQNIAEWFINQLI